MLLKIVGSAQNLDVLGVFRTAALGIRDDVVEVQVMGAATLDAATFVPLPYFKFNCAWDYAIILFDWDGSFSSGIRFSHHAKHEFEYLAPAVGLLPPIDEFEESVVDPNSITNLFEDSDLLSSGTARLVTPGPVHEEPVLCRPAIWLTFRLIDSLRVWAIPPLWDIVPLVDDYRATLLDSVLVRSTTPHAHENHALAVPETKIHSTLKIDGKGRAHLEIRNDIARMQHARCSVLDA